MERRPMSMTCWLETTFMTWCRIVQILGLDMEFVIMLVMKAILGCHHDGAKSGESETTFGHHPVVAT